MYLNNEQVDLFREMINVGVGKSAALLHEMIDAHIKLYVPNVWFTSINELREYLKQTHDTHNSAIKLNFNGPFSGIAEVVFPYESAVNLVALLTGEDADSPDMDKIRVGTLNEVANIILNGVMGSIANILDDTFSYSVPVYLEGDYNFFLLNEVKEDSVVLMNETHFEAKSLNVEGKILLALQMSSFEKLKSGLDKLINGN
ncbi:MAG: chemotaxis protein CheC [Ignavibacteria bacterium]|nr:chemotaxis protein CheC [Ignavibacteria bacterium]